jgi:hypothetical protein
MEPMKKGDSPLFPHALTPQRLFLLKSVRAGISRQTLGTSDLQLALLHFREIGLGDWLWESASSIAHARRDQGTFWTWALNVWTTHLFYQHLKSNEFDVSVLPLDVFNTLIHLIGERSERQLTEDLDHIYPNGITKAELFATLEHMYRPKPEKSKRQEPVFVTFVSKGGNYEEDVRLVTFLVRYCEDMALAIPPSPMDELLDEIEHAFAILRISRKRFSSNERIYLKLHLLICFHNVLVDIQTNVFQAVTHKAPPASEAMLSVSAMEDTLGLDIAFYIRRKSGKLDQIDLYSPDREERFRIPLVTSGLDAKAYLLESDLNIRCCLYNHPLEVRKHHGKPKIVALQRSLSDFKTTRSRLSEPSFW